MRFFLCNKGVNVLTVCCCVGRQTEQLCCALYRAQNSYLQGLKYRPNVKCSSTGLVLFYFLRASSYEPSNRTGLVGGTNFVFCSYGKFNPSYQDEKCPKGPQNIYLWNRVLICQRPYKPCAVENVPSRTVPVFGLECTYGKNFQLSYQDLGNRASLPSHMNSSKFL